MATKAAAKAAPKTTEEPNPTAAKAPAAPRKAAAKPKPEVAPVDVQRATATTADGAALRTTGGVDTATQKGHADPDMDAVLSPDLKQSNTKGALGSKVLLTTRNPINTQLVNEGEVVKIINEDYRVIAVPLLEGGVKEITATRQPGQNQEPYWR